MPPCTGCSDVYVLQWTKGTIDRSLSPFRLNITNHRSTGNGNWQRHRIPARQLCTNQLSNGLPDALTESPVSIMSVYPIRENKQPLTSPRFASANEIRTCPRCRPIFTETLHIPELWWSDCCRRSNGYFGCEITRNNGDVIEYSNYMHLPQYDLANKI